MCLNVGNVYRLDKQGSRMYHRWISNYQEPQVWVPKRLIKYPVFYVSDSLYFFSIVFLNYVPQMMFMVRNGCKRLTENSFSKN